MKTVYFLFSPMFYGYYIAIIGTILIFLWDINPKIVPLAILYLLAVGYVVVYHKSIKKKEKNLEDFLVSNLKSAKFNQFDTMSTPGVCFNEKGQIVWSNQVFAREFLQEGGKNSLIWDIFPELKEHKENKIKEVTLSFNTSTYTGDIRIKEYEKKCLYFLFLREDTYLKVQANLYQTRKPCILYVLLDNFEENLSLTKESDKNQIIHNVETTLEQISKLYKGIFHKVSKDKFSMVLTKSDIDHLMQTKFKSFQQVSTIQYDEGNTLTVSVGVGIGGEYLGDNDTFANQALDMALGRGGDQCVVKNQDQYHFFGESLRGNQKRSKVKAKFMSNALIEMITTSSDVLIMGHKFADFDSLASALGVWKMANIMGKKAAIAIDEEKTISETLLEYIVEKNKEVTFLNEEDALEVIGPKTLLVIMDTHSKSLIQFNSVYEKSSNIFVIDHHRKVINHIDDAVVFYHEPASSSTSEMVTEMFQYFALKYKNADTVTAEALLTGISLDTRNFSIRTSVRTFDAASYLKQCGADTIKVRKFFSQSADVYRFKNYILGNMELFHNCGISYININDHRIRTVAPQTADEMLQINEVEGSFVLYFLEGEINISARSFGNINVQIIMEKLGGGGHLTMAGAQIKDKNSEEVIHQLKEIILAYFQDKKS